MRSTHHRTKYFMANGNLSFSEPLRWGAFTMVTAYHKTGLIGQGIARKNDTDPENYDIGVQVAQYRAADALLKRLRGQPVHHPLAG